MMVPNETLIANLTDRCSLHKGYFHTLPMFGLQIDGLTTAPVPVRYGAEMDITQHALLHRGLRALWGHHEFMSAGGGGGHGGRKVHCPPAAV